MLRGLFNFSRSCQHDIALLGMGKEDLYRPSSNNFSLPSSLGVYKLRDDTTQSLYWRGFPESSSTSKNINSTSNDTNSTSNNIWAPFIIVKFALIGQASTSNNMVSTSNNMSSTSNNIIKCKVAMTKNQNLK